MQLSEASLKGRKFAVILTFLFTLLSYPSLTSISSYLESVYYPVVSQMHITKSERTYDNGTLIEGTYVRNRECIFKAVEWYLQTGDLDIAIPLERAPRDTNLPPGRYAFGPWKIFANQDELKERAYAVVYHRCHPLYLTKSYIYAKGNFR